MLEDDNELSISWPFSPFITETSPPENQRPVGDRLGKTSYDTHSVLTIAVWVSRADVIIMASSFNVDRGIPFSICSAVPV